MKKKKVLVYGYKKINLGDDLFFKMLFMRYPDTYFWFLGRKEYSEIFKEHKNVKVIYPYSGIDLTLSFIDKIMKFKNTESFIAKKVDYKVWITGSILGEREDVSFDSLPVSDKRLLILGANFDTYYTDNYLEDCKKYLMSAADVCFRDQRSKKIYESLENTRYAPDIIFGIKKYWEKLGVDSCKYTGIVNPTFKYVVISLISYKNRTKKIYKQENYLEGIKKIARFFISMGYKIVFLAFCEMEGDLDLVDEIKKDASINSESLYYSYRGGIEETLTIINESEVVVATRFHAMILGWVMEKRVLPIVYNQKMNNVLNDIGWENMICTTETICDLKDEELRNWYDNYCFRDFSKEVKASEIHFKELDKLLR